MRFPLLFLAIVFIACSGDTGTGPTTRSDKGTVQVVSSFWLPNLGKSRTLVVYLPPDYADSGLTYPVFYMHDGQNLFDPATAYAGNEWQIDETLDQLYTSYANDGIIVAGIYNGEADRWDEYSPWQITNLTNWCSWAGETVAGGDGGLYALDLANVVKPYIDAHFRTKPQKEYTAIGGSSMGGFISLYIGLNNQHLFSKIMAMSTAVWFDEDSLLAHLDSVTVSNHMKIYLDVGTLESSDYENPDFPAIYREGTETLYATFIGKGVASDRIRLVIDTNASHTESAWRQRFPGAVTWLYQ